MKKKSMSFHLKFVVLGQAGSKQDSIIRLSNPYSGLIFSLQQHDASSYVSESHSPLCAFENQANLFI